MIRTRKKQTRSRSGATAVEFAVVSIPCLMLLFGIYEFGRYLYVSHMLENAAREGARYAVVHTFEDTVETDTIAVVREMLLNSDAMGFGQQADVTVYSTDGQTGEDLGGPLQAKFGDYIWVRIRGTYRTILPNLLGISDGIEMDVRVTMLSEAN